MKRKLFSAILFGALLTASTSGLTSCKDYDDDISNLQSQIDKLATADQLSAKVSEMQAAISAAQSAAESKAAAAQTVADAAKAAAADAAAKAQSAADEAAKAKAAAAAVEEAMNKKIADLAANAATKEEQTTSGTLFCAGMIAGEGLVGILLAIFAVFGISTALSIDLGNIGGVVLMIVMIACLLAFSMKKKKN